MKGILDNDYKKNQKKYKLFLKKYNIRIKYAAGVKINPTVTFIKERNCLSLVAIIWNEGKDLEEWIEFHRLVGFEHIYLYDDGSTDNTKEVIKPFIEAGYISYMPWSHFLSGFDIQHMAYAHALHTFGPYWRWMAFIDLDEFLFPVIDKNLKEVLAKYEDFPAIVVPWHMYGFCGHHKRPDGLIIENYTERVKFPPSEKAKSLFKWKSIVDPNKVEAVDSAHFFVLKNNKKGGYSEDRRWIENKRPEDWRNTNSNIFQLNHYYTKSKEDFINRRYSGRDVKFVATPETTKKRADEIVSLIESEEKVRDELILKYSDELKSLIE